MQQASNGSQSGLGKKDRLYNQALDDVIAQGRQYSDDTRVSLREVRQRVESLRKR